MTSSVGLFPPLDLLATDLDGTARFLADAHDAGLDHVCCGDHVSFFVGAGSDGLLAAATLTALHPEIEVRTGVYLLALRHPVLVARQLADLAQRAPGRLTFGIGVGGEDPHELAVCGVDPSTRGRRTDEHLEVLRSLLTGRPTTFHGRFVDIDDALIAPAPAVGIPIVVGGRSDAALRRTARLGDGWLGIWCSPRRFAQAVEVIGEHAHRLGRPDLPRRHALQVWCGIGDRPSEARAAVAGAMEQLYQMPFERFERYCPYGSPEQVAEFLAPYVEAGCTSFNLLAQAGDAPTAVAGAASVRRELQRLVPHSSISHLTGAPALGPTIPQTITEGAA